MCIARIHARRDQRDLVYAFHASIAADQDDVTDAGVPEAEEHAGARVSIDIGVPTIAWIARTGKDERDMLRRRSGEADSRHVALRVSDLKRKIDLEPWHDDVQAG